MSLLGELLFQQRIDSKVRVVIVEPLRLASDALELEAESFSNMPTWLVVDRGLEHDTV